MRRREGGLGAVPRWRLEGACHHFVSLTTEQDVVNGTIVMDFS